MLRNILVRDVFILSMGKLYVFSEMYSCQKKNPVKLKKRVNQDYAVLGCQIALQ